MRISTIDKTVNEIFRSGYYKIPRFQRPYSWDNENIWEFWNDIVLSDNDEYFIGAVVVYKLRDDVFGIVDGQQRFTTITMLLSALRNILAKNGHARLSNGVHSLIERKNIDDQNEFIVSPETSFPYFQEHIQRQGEARTSDAEGEEEKRIISGFKYINTLYKNLLDEKTESITDEETKKATIETILVSVRDKLLALKLIFIELDNENDAYLIFETLNTRGKELNTSDLVKNLLTRYIPNQNAEVDIVKIKWQNLIETITGTSRDIKVQSFLHHYWLSKYDYIPAKNLFSSIRDEITHDVADNFLDDIYDNSKLYRTLYEPNFYAWTNQERSIQNSIEAISTFNVRQQLPLVLSILRSYKEGLLSIKNCSKALKCIEDFIFIYTTITQQRSSGGTTKMYASFAKRIFQASTQEEKNRVIQDMRRKFRELRPEQEEFTVGLKSVRFSDLYNKEKNVVRYILTKFTKLYQPTVKHDFRALTIEHLYPQHPTGDFPKIDEFDQIGNLLFLDADTNDKLGNKTYTEKKVILEDSIYHLDEMISGNDDWNSQQIIQRTEYMAEIGFTRIWKI